LPEIFVCSTTCLFVPKDTFLTKTLFASYILSLQGTTPGKGKAAEGDLWESE
jgi:hypothetical protein